MNNTRNSIHQRVIFHDHLLNPFSFSLSFYFSFSLSIHRLKEAGATKIFAILTHGVHVAGLFFSSIKISLFTLLCRTPYIYALVCELIIHLLSFFSFSPNPSATVATFSGLFSGNAVDKLNSSALEAIVVYIY